MNIIITGASKGIGKAVAEKFAASGYDIYLCARSEGPLKELAEKLVKRYPGVKVEYTTCDVALKGEVKKFGEWVLSKTRSIDVLVNNAGTYTPGNVHEEPEGALEHLMNTNVYSAYYLSRHLLPPMMKKKSGHVFNICSIASLKAYPNGGSYSITKYALAGFSANLRDEMRAYNVKVTSVFPGAVWTASWDQSGVEQDRIMKASDIAELIFTAANLSPQACVEEIVVRPQLGDL
jgi:short-subunit dehydrogenase